MKQTQNWLIVWDGKSQWREMRIFFCSLLCFWNSFKKESRCKITFLLSFKSRDWHKVERAESSTIAPNSQGYVIPRSQLNDDTYRRGGEKASASNQFGKENNQGSKWMFIFIFQKKDKLKTGPEVINIRAGPSQPWGSRLGNVITSLQKCAREVGQIQLTYFFLTLEKSKWGGASYYFNWNQEL